MEQMVVKKEPEELVDDFEGGISMNYPGPEMPSTSGKPIKPEIKEECDYNEWFDKRSKINDSDEGSENCNDGDESEDLLCNIKKEGRNSDFYEDDENSSHNEVKDEDEAMFETKFMVEYYDESGTDGEVLNKEIVAKEVLPKAEKENRQQQCLKPGARVGEEKFFKCDICPKKYHTKNSLLKHEKYYHKKDELEKFKCNICDYVTVRKDNFKIHLNTHGKKNYIKCHFCDYTAAELKTLNAHVLSKHKIENKEEKIKITSKIHECAKCLYSTVKKSSYDQHIKVCLKLENVKWYNCHHCDYKTLQKSHLKRHIKSHTKIKE